MFQLKLHERNQKFQETLFVTYENIICECDQNYIKNISCGTSLVNEFVNASTFRFSTAKEIKSLKVNVVIFRQQSKQYSTTLMNATMNFCSLVKSRKNNLLIMTALESFKNTNIWKGCPLDVCFQLT